MGYADSIRTTAPTMEAVATLIENLFTSSGALEWSTWTPTASTPASTMTLTGGTFAHARYTTIGKLGIYTFTYSATLGGAVETAIRVTLPWTIVNQNLAASVTINNSGLKAGIAQLDTTTRILLYKYDGSVYTAAAGSVTVTGIVELP